jgi:adenosylcobinamide-GDP ribazoletransferase
VNAFFAAVQFLTLFPRPWWMQHSTSEVGRSAIFYPVVGLILGLILVLVNFLLLPFASAGLLSVILITLLAFMTRGLHLDGVGDTFDGLGAGGDRDRVLSIMDDSHTGVFGLIAIVLVLFFKIHAIESIDVDRWRALLVAPILGRWAMVLLAYRSKAAKAGLGSNLIEHLQTKHFLLATLVTLLLVAAIWRRNGIVMMAWVAVFTIASKNYFYRLIVCVTGDTLV